MDVSFTQGVLFVKEKSGRGKSGTGVSPVIGWNKRTGVSPVDGWYKETGGTPIPLLKKTGETPIPLFRPSAAFDQLV